MARWHYQGLHGKPKMFTRSLSTFGLYVLLAGFLAVGYFVGLTRNIGTCGQQCLPLKDQGLAAEPSLRSILVVLIFSAPQNEYARDTIRKTWLQAKGDSSIRHFFVVGTATLNVATEQRLAKENSTKRDMLFLEHVSDSYLSLTKKLVEALKWVHGHIPFDFLLKVDDDSFVRLDALFNLLFAHPQKKLYWGFFDGRSPVHQRGKWVESNWNLCDTYLPYAKGGGYILSFDLVEYIARNAELLSLFRSEDVSLGAWLAPLHIHRVHDNRFDTEYKSRGCFNSYLVTHKQTETMIITKYRNLLALGHMCSKEKRYRLSYVYNWKVPPSMCCIRNDSSVP